LERLAGADGFGSLGLNRRDALWAVRGLKGSGGAENLPLFAAAGRPAHEEAEDADLPPLPPGEDVIHDYKSLSLSLKAHPVSFLRAALQANNILSCEEMDAAPNGRIVSVAGLVLVRQRPGTASGVIFETLEDETGIANVVIWPKIFEANRRAVLGARLLGVKGQVQKADGVVHLIARELTDYTSALLAMADGHDIGSSALARATRQHAPHAPYGPYRPVPSPLKGAPNQAQKAAHAALPAGRNFH
jgi:error-prone DNA polymerase